MNINNYKYQDGNYASSQTKYRRLQMNLILTGNYNVHNQLSKTTHNLRNSYSVAANRYATAISSNRPIESFYNIYPRRTPATELSFTALKSSLKSRYLQRDYHNDIFDTNFNEKRVVTFKKSLFLQKKILHKDKENTASTVSNVLSDINYLNLEKDVHYIPVIHYPAMFSEDLERKMNDSNKSQLSEFSKTLSKQHIVSLTNEIILSKNQKFEVENINDINYNSNTFSKTLFDIPKQYIENEFKEKKFYCYLPNEMLWEMVQFLSFNDCAKIAIVSRVFTYLTEPRLKLKIQLVSNF